MGSSYLQGQEDILPGLEMKLETRTDTIREALLEQHIQVIIITYLMLFCMHISSFTRCRLIIFIFSMDIHHTVCMSILCTFISFLLVLAFTPLACKCNLLQSGVRCLWCVVEWLYLGVAGSSPAGRQSCLLQLSWKSTGGMNILLCINLQMPMHPHNLQNSTLSLCTKTHSIDMYTV